MRRMQFEDSYYESKIRSLKIRYARKRRRIVIIFLIMAIISFTTVGFIMNRPGETGTSSQPVMPVYVDISRANYAGIRNNRNLTHSKVPAEPKYLLNNTNCRVQDFPPFHDEVVPYFEKRSLDSCFNLPLLSSVSANGNGTHTLHFHKEYIPMYIHGTEMFCCYSIMSLSSESADFNSDIMVTSKCQTLTSDVILNQTIEYVQVNCHIVQTTAFSDDESIDLYKNVHAFVGMKPAVNAKMDGLWKVSPLHHEEKRDQSNNEATSSYSVMIFGIDSMSRLNFLRTMPRTAKYLEDNGWMPLKVHNKVGENTMPNLAAAVLAGVQVETFNSTCWSRGNGTLDDCPWIFKKFAERGYVTAYGEDTPQLDTFSTRKFSKPPTDYFLRPFMRAAERLSSSSWYEKYLKFFECLGPVHGVDHVLNYSLEFTDTFRNHPTFSLFWLNTFSHYCLNCPGGWDGKISKYFENLESIRNNTVVIFMSDHGIGEGRFRLTNMGFFESNLPFVYFSVPDSFARTFPQQLENLRANEYKLTSHFDVHATLLDLLGKETFVPGCPKCRSLFEELPLERSCAEAGIPERYCACTEYDIVSNTTPYRFMGEFVVQELNAIRTSYEKYAQKGQRCAAFSLKGMKPIKIAVPRTESILQSIKNAFSAQPDHDLFVITLETMPRAVFEATLSLDTNGTLKTVNTISRLDMYEMSSECMEDQDGKKYCMCESNRVEF